MVLNRLLVRLDRKDLGPLDLHLVLRVRWVLLIPADRCPQRHLEDPDCRTLLQDQEGQQVQRVRLLHSVLVVLEPHFLLESLVIPERLEYQRPLEVRLIRRVLVILPLRMPLDRLGSHCLPENQLHLDLQTLPEDRRGPADLADPGDQADH